MTDKIPCEKRFEKFEGHLKSKGDIQGILSFFGRSF
jgi:hypothetical protein